MTEYYIVNFKFDKKFYYCIWYTNDEDGFVISENRLLCFEELDRLKMYCNKQKICIDNNITLCDVDGVISFINLGNTKDIEYKLYLNLWNLCSDLAHTLSIDFYGNHDGITLDIYNLLFYGSNPPAMNDKNEEYVPKWDDEDVTELKKVLKSCYDLIERYVVKNIK